MSNSLHLSRIQKQLAPMTHIRLASLEVDFCFLRAYLVSGKRKKRLRFTTLDFVTLMSLIHAKDGVLTKKEALDRITSERSQSALKYVDVRISLLRTHLKGTGLLIKAVPRKGWRLVSESEWLKKNPTKVISKKKPAPKMSATDRKNAEKILILWNQMKKAGHGKRLGPKPRTPSVAGRIAS